MSVSQPFMHWATVVQGPSTTQPGPWMTMFGPGGPRQIQGPPVTVQGPWQVSQVQTGTIALQDALDGTPNGQTAVNGLMNLVLNNQTFEARLVGFSAGGAPVFTANVFGVQQRFIAANAPLTTDTNINFTTWGTYTYCFAAGTGIATPSGEVAVEALAIGDKVLTADGRTIPVRWIGRQMVSNLFAGERARPVLIRAGALGDGLPRADLTVTADHGMVIDGLVINAGALVNGTTITSVPLAELPATVTYYHVETADHHVILANGAPAETFVDYAGRAAFDNYAEYLALYGAPQMIAELRAPRITSARLLPASIRARLAPTIAA